MAKPWLLGDSLAETTILHPTFVLSNPDGDDAQGREVWRVCDNLRDMTSWSTTGTNVLRKLRLDTLATTTVADTVIIDRGSNLGGATITLKSGNASPPGTTVFTATVPTTAGGLPGNANGCVTTDGVFVKTFAQTTGRYFDLEIPALGVVAPIVTGYYLGKRYVLPEYLDAPAAYDYRTRVTFAKTERSRGGVLVKSRPVNYGELDLSLSLEGADYPAFDAEVRRLIDYGQPWWVCLDDADATLAGLTRLFQHPGEFTFDPHAAPVHREVRMTLEECIPTLRR